MDIRFKEIRKFISRIDRVSICMKETGGYENFQFISEVPEKYDDFFLYGIGMIRSEFPVEQAIDEAVRMGLDIDSEDKDSEIYAPCIEIMLSETPRTEADEAVELSFS